MKPFAFWTMLRSSEERLSTEFLHDCKDFRDGEDDLLKSKKQTNEVFHAVLA